MVTSAEENLPHVLKEIGLLFAMGLARENKLARGTSMDSLGRSLQNWVLMGRERVEGFLACLARAKGSFSKSGKGQKQQSESRWEFAKTNPKRGHDSM